MSQITEKLNLLLPELDDEIHQTILDLSINFQKLDDAAENFANSYPSYGYWVVGEKVWNNNPDIGEYAGWVNIREGVAAPKWTAITQFNVGDLIIPTTNNGHYYECIQSGYSSVNEPTFPTVSDSEVEDTKGKQVWQASKHYNLSDVIVPTIDNDCFYICTVAGESGTTEPNWSTNNGGINPDGMATWTGYRIVTWKESGTSANFRPFGKIE